MTERPRALRFYHLPVLLLMAAGASLDFSVNCRALGAAFRAVGWEATPLWMGLLAASTPGCYFLALLFFGRVSDVVGRRRAATLGLVLNLVALLGHYYSTQVWHLVAWACLFGAGGAFFWPTLSAWFSDLAAGDPRRLNRMLGNFNVAWSGGMTFGALFGGVIWQALGPLTFLALAGLLSLMTAGVQLVPEVVRRSAADSEPPEPAHPDNRRFLLISRLGTFLGWFTTGTLLTILPKLTPRLGLSESGTGFAVGGYYLAVLLCIWAGRSSRRWQYRRWTLFFTSPLAVLGMTVLLGARTVPLMAAACFLAGVSAAFSVVSAMYYALHGRTQGQASATTVHETVVGIGGVTGAMLSGSLAEALIPSYGPELALRSGFLLVLTVGLLLGLAQLLSWRLLRPPTAS